MQRAGSAPEAPPAIGAWRAVLHVGGTSLRVLAALAAVGLLGAPIWLALGRAERGAGAVGALVIAGLVLLGAGLPVIAAVAARSDWRAVAWLLGADPTDGPTIRLTEPRSLVRPLAYTVVLLTLGGAAAVLIAVLVVAAVVALASPILVAAGDHAVIGPFAVDTAARAVVAVAAALVVLAGLVAVAPPLARAHAAVVRQVLTRPEQRLRRDLATTALSRARLVRAFDVERRRIERDLHDGVQPQLLSVSMTLGLALAAMPADAPGRADVLRAQQQARSTLDALRGFVRNIHPQVLIDHGLVAAVSELADTLPVPITITDRLGDRLPAEVETNLYFCIAELMANVAKHSLAEHAQVELERPAPGRVRVTVRDDGRGGAASNGRVDGGLAGIADRVAALGGSLLIDSPLGGPTIAAITVAAPGKEANR